MQHGHTIIQLQKFNLNLANSGYLMARFLQFSKHASSPRFLHICNNGALTFLFVFNEQNYRHSALSLRIL